MVLCHASITAPPSSAAIRVCGRGMADGHADLNDPTEDPVTVSLPLREMSSSARAAAGLKRAKKSKQDSTARSAPALCATLQVIENEEPVSSAPDISEMPLERAEMLDASMISSIHKPGILSSGNASECGKRCSSCTDTGNLIMCSTPACSNMICIQAKLGEHGCLVVNAFDPKAFYCPKCLFKAKKTIPYQLTSYTTTFLHHSSEVPAIVLFTMVYGEKERPKKMIKIHLEEKCHASPHSFKHFDISMNGVQAHPSTLTKRLNQFNEWVASLNERRPTALVFVDTHSNSIGGGIVFGTNGHRMVSSDVENVVNGLMGKAIHTAMRGACRRIGILMLTCGPSFTFLSHFQKIRGLVERRAYDFVLGFSGDAVIPALVIPYMLIFTHSIIVSPDIDIWAALLDTFCRGRNPLSDTPAVLIFRDEKDEVQALEVAYSVPNKRMWGLDHKCPQCGSGINLESTKTAKNTGGGCAKFACHNCGWKTPPGITVPQPSWVTWGKGTHCYYHPYPIPEEQGRYLERWWACQQAAGNDRMDIG
ncbi:hypothetical protein EW146_g3517 [Bondarzewia mesenterica]|uniref:Uncharacterized protein n=1 Tax=Bondarzewia mesenterica TaxID=1095465 RepID=A0A4S4LXT5_9AGAM|nr:hypothetical protein EW146_g3517 [Bondarzewia mesenterica]